MAPLEAQGAISRAIAQKRLIHFDHEGRRRVAEPHLLAHDGDGALVLSAWQVSGGGSEGWRVFRVDDLSHLTVAQEVFERPRPGYDPEDASFERVVSRL